MYDSFLILYYKHNLFLMYLVGLKFNIKTNFEVIMLMYIVIILYAKCSLINH